MLYSIVIPVFNKAALTRVCLQSLAETLPRDTLGEVIVVDNGSTDDTATVLAEFPWIKTIVNERNLGFAVANNQGAAVASGRILVLLNNDTKALPGWLEAMLAHFENDDVGAVGARLLFGDGLIQHAGVIFNEILSGVNTMAPTHYGFLAPGEEPTVMKRRDVQAVTGACLATSRALYVRLGGLDEGFWNGYEDVDYCLKIRHAGLRIVYEPKAVLFHYESQSGSQRFRRVMPNIARLEGRWRDFPSIDAGLWDYERHLVKRTVVMPNAIVSAQMLPTPSISIVVHGETAKNNRARIERALRAAPANIESILWTANDDLEAARKAMELRGNRYAFFLDARLTLAPSWFEHLSRRLEIRYDALAATGAPESMVGFDASPACGDARALLVALWRLPQHYRLADFPTIDGALADLCVRALELGLGVVGMDEPVFESSPEPARDDLFERTYQRSIASLIGGDDRFLMERLAAIRRPTAGLVSIVTLSWNAPEYTKLAIASLLARTREPFEIIVVDNGSGPETVAYLRSIDDPHVRVIYNATNRGFGAGNNIGLAAANGEFVVVLNNDVLVSDGWLDALLRPYRDMRAVGITAPRSNSVSGHQQIPNARYDDEAAMLAFAAERGRLYSGRGYFTDRAVGFCLCMPRELIDEIGGFDERFGVGNFEDDDLCMRARAAGYKIFVCEDAFIHHFGSRSFVANNVDYGATMRANWSYFAGKWGYPPAYPESGYDPRTGYFIGFDRALHYAALPKAGSTVEGEEGAGGTAALAVPGVRFLADVADGDAAWEPVGRFLRRYFRAFRAQDGIVLTLRLCGAVDSATIERRIERVLSSLNISADICADVEVVDADEELVATLHTIDISEIKSASPSALRRLLEVKNR
ncbi:MAG: glycosyltransferase family 2 protein [Candidatus Eremiobacteraeota bacterium]|uniref:Glycosyltransferase 2-like domain-containing protein n=1 Tax=mine drainage metagenome TaxID=410659 RepID=E6PCB4_9ZZZZ|nr:glycosyltransferase family 2 protein [Candidatus Eremiobacteraeota bacterium]